MTDTAKAGWGCLTTIVITPLAIFLRAWALCVLWRWFLVPIGLPVLTYEQASGISIIFGFLCPQPPPINGQESGAEKWVRAIIVAFVLPLVSVGMGAFVRWLL